MKIQIGPGFTKSQALKLFENTGDFVVQKTNLNKVLIKGSHENKVEH